MKVLEDEKLKRQKLRQLKRTKSGSGDLNIAPAVATPAATTATVIPIAKVAAPTVQVPSPAAAAKKDLQKPTPPSTNKVTEYLNKISQLDLPAQQRLIEKTEHNFKTQRYGVLIF